jgi:hypothetical protein
MKYSIKVINIEGRLDLIRVLRTLEPGLSLIDAKAMVWEKKTVDLSEIRRERHPLRNFKSDFVFTQDEFAYVTRELDNQADFEIGRKEEGIVPTVEEAFRAGFEAGIATDYDVEEAWEKYQADIR